MIGFIRFELLIGFIRALAGKINESVASIRLSVCLSVRLFPLYIVNRLTFEPESLYVYGS